MSDTTLFFTLLTLIIISAVFSAGEAAYLSSSKARLNQIFRNRPTRAVRKALQMSSDPEPMLTTSLLINTLTNSGAAALSTMYLVRVFGEMGVAYATLGMSAILLVFAEVMPKIIGSRYAESVAIGMAPTYAFCITVCKPLVKLVNGINHVVLSFIGLGKKGQGTFTENDIRGAINLGVEHGTIQHNQQRMMDAVLDLDHLTVADVMIHRSAIAALDINTPATNIPAVLAGLKHSRVPVYEGTPDNIVGFLSVRDYLGALSAVTNRAQVKLKTHVRPTYFVPETTPVGHQLLEFLRQRCHLALVVDEYGALQGLITLEDILEEIVGDIADEHDRQGAEEHLPDGTLRLPGRAAVRDLNRKHNWQLPEDNAVTLAGLMIDVLRHLPAQGETVQVAGLTLTVASKRGHRVEWVRVRTPKPAAPTEPDSESPPAAEGNPKA